MKLFGDFDAVRFPEENLIFITRDEYIYYIYTPEYNHWRKHENAGNDHITLSNYQDISKEDLMAALGGRFPAKETDFMRFCHPSDLCIRDMLDLFKEDYPRYMADAIYNTVHEFLLVSDICYKSYLKLRELFDRALALDLSHEQVLEQVKALSFTIIGRDIFKKEIGIVDGHDSSSCFWIMPTRVIDYSDSDSIDNVAKMRSSEISIEENDVYQYLAPFLCKYFDRGLEANKNRVNDYWEDEAGHEHATYVAGFAWNLTHNYYTYDSTAKILADIKDTMAALSSGEETEYTNMIKGKPGSAENELIVDFYRRFFYRMEYMMTVGKEKGYDLISFMGP